MRPNQTIRAFLGSFLLLVLVIGITPKRYWHDVFANHQDTFTSTKSGDNLQVNKTGFNCDWNMQVATSPFLEQDEVCILPSQPSHNLYLNLPASQLSHSDVSHRTLRGPPSIG